MIKSVFFGLVLLSPYALAETLEVGYASFYSHVKKLDEPDTDALRFAFGFWHIAEKRLCKIESAKIVTQKQQIPLLVEPNYRFTVPVDKILKMAKALVVLEFADQANQCDMSVQLETVPDVLKTYYTNGDLRIILNQYQAFFDEMGGFLSFIMPSVQGLSVQVESVEGLTEELIALIDEKGRLQLSNKWIEQNNSLKLSEKPLRITAKVNK